MFTDGLTDRRDKGGRAFGHRRLQQAVGQTRHPGGADSLTKVRDDVLANVTSFADGVPADDDVTLVVCAVDRV